MKRYVYRPESLKREVVREVLSGHLSISPLGEPSLILHELPSVLELVVGEYEVEQGAYQKCTNERYLLLAHPCAFGAVKVYE